MIVYRTNDKYRAESIASTLKLTGAVIDIAYRNGFWCVRLGQATEYQYREVMLLVNVYK